MKISFHITMFYKLCPILVKERKECKRIWILFCLSHNIKACKEFLKLDISKLYILVVGIICLLLIGGYFSFAIFTVNREKNNAISIITGNLTYKLEVDGVESNTLIVAGNTTKDFTVTLSNINNRTARFNFYYVGSLPSNVEAGYKIKKVQILLHLVQELT